MKKIIEKEVQICDCCGKETYCDSCLRCGLEHCWECRKECGVEYTHGVHFSGSGDGYYCTICNDELAKQGPDNLYNCYVKIANLKKESKEWYLDFHARSDKAEARLKQLVGI